MFDPQSLSLRGRRALVTGGATGIGAAIAEAFAACGADVAVTAHRHGADSVLRTINELGRKGARMRSRAADTRSGGGLGRAGASCLGPLDVLVNNAGIIRRAEAMDHSFEDVVDRSFPLRSSRHGRHGVGHAEHLLVQVVDLAVLHLEVAPEATTHPASVRPTLGERRWNSSVKSRPSLAGSAHSPISA